MGGLISFWIILLIGIIPASISTPTPALLPPPIQLRLGSDEIRITSENRDVCLAKLLCGMSVVSIQDAYKSGTKDGEIYGNYAQIVAKFFQENPSDEYIDDDEEGSLSQESMEALEDYSVSTEYGDDDEEETLPLYSQIRRKRPEIRRKFYKPMKSAARFTTPAPKKVVTPKPTPPMIQIFDLGMPIQENKKGSSRNLETISEHKAVQDTRTARARKILRKAGLETTLRTVRQCQRISGCKYTFRQLYQKYGGKGVIDEESQPIQRLPVVEERPSRPFQNGDPKLKGRPEGKDPLDNFWTSPPVPNTSTPVTQLNFDELEFGGLNSKTPSTGLESYFSTNLDGVHAPPLSLPGTTYKIRKPAKKTSSLFKRVPGFKKRKQKRKRTTTTEATTTTTTTTTKPTTTTTTTTTPPPRRVFHYKRRPSKKRPPIGEDDEEEDINKTFPVKLVSHHEHDYDTEALDQKLHNSYFEYDDRSSNESHDDYDEEAKFNVSVEYGNDEETEEEDDDDSDEITEPKRRKPNPLPVWESIKRKKKKKPSESQIIRIPGGKPKGHAGYSQTHSHQSFSSRPKSKPKEPLAQVSKLTNEFQSPQKRLKKKKQKGDEDDSSEEAYDDSEFDDEESGEDDDGPPPFHYPSHIGGRPIFPDYDVPVTAYGMTRTTMPVEKKSRPRPGPGSSNKKSWKNRPTSQNPYPYQFPASTTNDEQSSGLNEGGSYKPTLTSTMSVLTPFKSLFKHLSSGFSPNPVGGSMGYIAPTPFRRPEQVGGFPGGITVPILDDEKENPEVPQIAIMPKIPVGPASSKYKRPPKYTVNKTKKIPSL